MDDKSVVGMDISGPKVSISFDTDRLQQGCIPRFVGSMIARSQSRPCISRIPSARSRIRLCVWSRWQRKVHQVRDGGLASSASWVPHCRLGPLDGASSPFSRVTHIFSIRIIPKQSPWSPMLLVVPLRRLVVSRSTVGRIRMGATGASSAVFEARGRWALLLLLLLRDGRLCGGMIGFSSK